MSTSERSELDRLRDIINLQNKLIESYKFQLYGIPDSNLTQIPVRILIHHKKLYEDYITIIVNCIEKFLSTCKTTIENRLKKQPPSTSSKTLCKYRDDILTKLNYSNEKIFFKNLKLSETSEYDIFKRLRSKHYKELRPDYLEKRLKYVFDREAVLTLYDLNKEELAQNIFNRGNERVDKKQLIPTKPDKQSRKSSGGGEFNPYKNVESTRKTKLGFDPAASSKRKFDPNNPDLVFGKKEKEEDSSKTNSKGGKDRDRDREKEGSVEKKEKKSKKDRESLKDKADSDKRGVSFSPDTKEHDAIGSKKLTKKKKKQSKLANDDSVIKELNTNQEKPAKKKEKKPKKEDKKQLSSDSENDSDVEPVPKKKRKVEDSDSDEEAKANVSTTSKRVKSTNRTLGSKKPEKEVAISDSEDSPPKKVEKPPEKPNTKPKEKERENPLLPISSKEKKDEQRDTISSDSETEEKPQKPKPKPTAKPKEKPKEKPKPPPSPAKKFKPVKSSLISSDDDTSSLGSDSDLDQPMKKQFAKKTITPKPKPVKVKKEKKEAAPKSSSKPREKPQLSPKTSSEPQPKLARKSFTCYSCFETNKISKQMGPFKHPNLDVCVCKDCFNFLNQGGWTYNDEDGKCDYCFISGDGGDIMSCDVCPNSFTTGVLKQWYGDDFIEELDADETIVFKCMKCDMEQGYYKQYLAESKICYKVLEQIKSGNFGGGTPKKTPVSKPKHKIDKSKSKIISSSDSDSDDEKPAKVPDNFQKDKKPEVLTPSVTEKVKNLSVSSDKKSSSLNTLFDSDTEPQITSKENNKKDDKIKEASQNLDVSDGEAGFF